MKISKIIIDKILNDSSFSIKIATILKIKQASVEALARRNSDKLAHAKLVELYKQEGFSETDLWEI